MRWVEHVAHIGETRNFHRILVGIAEGLGPLRMIILEQILEKYDVNLGIHSTGSEQGPVANSYEDGDDFSD